MIVMVPSAKVVKFSVVVQVVPVDSAVVVMAAIAASVSSILIETTRPTSASVVPLITTAVCSKALNLSSVIKVSIANDGAVLSKVMLNVGATKLRLPATSAATLAAIFTDTKPSVAGVTVKV